MIRSERVKIVLILVFFLIIVQQGSLQENNLCRVMEGGRDAFARRYRRMITEGGKDV